MKSLETIGMFSLGLILIVGYCAMGQTTSGAAVNASSTGISIAIQPSKAAATDASSLVITVTISNSANQFLVRNYAV